MNVDNIYKINSLKLLKKMMCDNEFSYDVYFRMAVIEEYFNNNNQIWDLYDNMQFTRANLIRFVPKHMINHKDKFIELINSIKDNGFDSESPLLVNKDYMVIDGAHRMACALYFNIDDVFIKTTDEYINFIPNEYTKKWFEENNLSECIPYAEKQKEKIKELIKDV